MKKSRMTDNQILAILKQAEFGLPLPPLVLFALNTTSGCERACRLDLDMAYHSSVGCDLGGDQPTGYAIPSAYFHTPEIIITHFIKQINDIIIVFISVNKWINMTCHLYFILYFVSDSLSVFKI